MTDGLSVKKVLILTAGFGDGHNTAARNLAEAFELISGDVKVEVLDLFQSSLGIVNDVLRKAYLGLARFAPGVWGGIYSLLDNSRLADRRLIGFAHLKGALGQILDETQPDCVISTYPLYGHVIQDLYRDHAERPFCFLTVITDSISVNASWYRAPSDWFCVPNEATAQVLRDHGVPPERMQSFGFPVNPVFAEAQLNGLTDPIDGLPRRILYIINTGKKKCGKAIDRLLEFPSTRLTVTVGRDAELKEKLLRRTRHCADRIRVLSWTNQMPQLMLNHHLVVTKAGGATVQEAIAARCPMILNQVIPGQEDGNAQWVRHCDVGAIAEKNGEVVEWVERVFAREGRLWRQWRENLTRICKPDASLRIAELALSQCDRDDPRRKRVRLFKL